MYIIFLIFSLFSAPSFSLPNSIPMKNICRELTIDITHTTPWIACLNQYATTYNAHSLLKDTPKPSRPLFEQYPLLHSLPHINLCNLPTPVEKLETLGTAVNAPHLWIKRDDLSGILYGGNKPRKLEFELAKAVEIGASTIITFGCAGSNHAVACSEYARMLGLKPICMLKPQENSHTVRKNLSLHQVIGTELHYYPDTNLRELGTIALWLDEYNNTGKFPYIIPTGGSTPLGTLGFVNAAFELKQQIDTGQLPMPDYIYVPCGSLATTVGLLLGCKAAHIPVIIVAVAIEPTENQDAFKEVIIKLFRETNELLHTTDASFPLLEFPMERLEINHNFCGPAYAEFTAEGMQAYHLLKTKEDIVIDGTYTAKALAALLADINTGKNNNQVILFWNTYCGLDMDTRLIQSDYRNLPHCFHPYFEESVQQLDTTKE